MKKLVVLMVAGVALLAGCKDKPDQTENYIKALDASFSKEQSCLFTQTMQLPLQVYADDQTYAPRFDALLAQGLLDRGTDTLKTKVGKAVTEKPVKIYDLSNKGTQAWTPDPKQPGYGNFCYGSKAVATLDSATDNSGEVGATTVVKFHTHVGGTPAWAMAFGTQNAFPELKSELTSKATGTATLTNTASGWVVTSGPTETK